MTDYDRVPAPGDYPEAVGDMTWPLLADGFTITWDPAPGGCALTLLRIGPRGQRDGYRATGPTMQAAWDTVQAQFAETLEDTTTPASVPRAAAPPAYSEHTMTPSNGDPEGQPSVSWQRGDRIALVHTSDPDTLLHPGDRGTVTRWDPAQGQLHVRWDSGSTLTMLPGEGDQVRALADGEPGEPGTAG